jgi:glutaredoxin
VKLVQGLLVLGLLGGGAALWAGPERLPGGSVSGLLDTARVSAEGPRVIYQFVDDAGNVRMVDRLADVPADRRDGVGRIEVPVEPVRTAKAKTAPDTRGLSYTNRDIEHDPGARDELVRLVGSTAVPVTVIGGKVIRGYDPDRLRKLVPR